jgi:ribonuclease P protein component
MAKEAGFGKKEKLKSRKLIENLFATGKSLNVFPIRVSYKFLSLQGEERSGMQVGVSVSKKNFKKAVERNRIKRLLREAYRLQKKPILELLKEKGLQGNVFFIYTDKSLPDYETVFATITKCLENLKRKAIAVREDRS